MPIFLPLLLLAADAAPDPVAAAIAAYRERTATVLKCQAPTDPDEISVCGLRRADRYRVPFILFDAGDPRHEGVPDERARYIHVNSPCEDRGPFLIGCGMVGVTMKAGAGGIHLETPRKLAP